jgi:hypothetical protein
MKIQNINEERERKENENFIHMNKKVVCCLEHEPFPVCGFNSKHLFKKKRGFGPLANYADRATAACWRSSVNFCE